MGDKPDCDCTCAAVVFAAAVLDRSLEHVGRVPGQIKFPKLAGMIARCRLVKRRNIPITLKSPRERELKRDGSTLSPLKEYGFVCFLPRSGFVQRLMTTVIVELTDNCYTPAHQWTAVMPLPERLFLAI
jgi:hypothetical protein